MRGSQIFAGLVIIVLLAMGLVYLDAHGYFHSSRFAAMRALKPDAFGPKAEPPEADQANLSSPGSGGGGLMSNFLRSRISTPAPAPGPAPSPAPAPTPVAAPSPAPAPASASGAGETPLTPTPVSATPQPTKVTYPSGRISVTVPSPTSSTVQATPPHPTPAAAPAAAASTAPVTKSAASATPAAPAETTKVIYKIVYVDAEGNACRAKRVAVRETSASYVTSTARVHHYRRHLVDNSGWIYGTSTPAPVAEPRRALFAPSTACSMLHQTANGQRLVNLPAGMTVNVALDRGLSTIDSAAGQEFNGFLVGPITYCGEVVVPAGATVQGTVVRTRRRSPGQEDDAVLQLRLSELDANGASVPLPASSFTRRSPGELPYHTVDYMNDPNFVETGRDSTRDVVLPAQSVVSFSLRASTAVSF